MSTERRQWLRGASAMAALAATTTWPARSNAHQNVGPVTKPAVVGDWQIKTHTGIVTQIKPLLTDKITFVQWMFTGCSSICPIQGAQFAHLHSELTKLGLIGQRNSPCQLLSLSIDTLGDDSAQLQRWLAHYSSPSGWLAGVPTTTQVDALRAEMEGAKAKAGSAIDPHTTQVFCYDASARLRWRSVDLPTTNMLVEAATHFVRAY